MKIKFLLISFVVVGLLFAGASFAADIKTGLLGYWPLNGNAKDMSGKGNDGEAVGKPEWVNGRRGQAVRLAGVVGGETQHIYVPSFKLVSNSITWVAWLNGSSNNTWTGIMMSRGTAGGGPNDNGIGFGDGTALHYTWTGNTTWNWHAGPKIPVDKWAMVAVSLEPTRTTAYVYTEADGLKSASNVANHPVETIERLRFGWDECCGGARWFKGMMDEVLIYGRSLTEGDITALITQAPAAIESLNKLATTWGSLK